MATVRLSDIIEPAVFMDYDAVNTVEKSAFVASGIVTRNPELDKVANEGGKTVEMPFWKDLANEEPDAVTDNPADIAVPSKIATGDQIARKAFLHKSWSTTDLASEIAGANALARIKERTNAYWLRQWQARLMASVVGVVAANVADDSGDMVHNVATDAAATPADGELFTRKNFTAAAFTLGDAFENTGAMAVHSVVYKRMLDNDDIDFVADSRGTLTVPTFLGRTIIIDDGLPVVAGVNRLTYTSVLFGAGAFGYGEGSPAVPVEVAREAAQGNGGGVDVLHTRKTWLVHPFGFAFNSASVSGPITPTLADLRKAANWVRVFDERKQVPLAFLKTNG